MELDKNDFEKIFKLIMDENKRNLKSVQDELAEVKLQLNEAAVIRGENIALRATIEDYKRNLEETKCELKSQGDRLRIVEADNIGLKASVEAKEEIIRILRSMLKKFLLF
jgi:hypothetical protein